MLIGITGTPGSGRKTAVAHLVSQGLEQIEFSPQTLDDVVSRWREHFVVLIPESVGELRKRPWFVHVNLAASESIRATRLGAAYKSADPGLAEQIENVRCAHVNLVNEFETVEAFTEALDKQDVLNAERVRPSWDRYFMTIADLAAQRSNCMKRRVGCVLVRENRIIATGYNGTPRHMLNCSEGGCPRCNSGSRGGTLLSTCLCLHAEENALLEAGRDRVASAILYCNTCPCLTCSIKIVQTGVSEVVYSQDYSMDHESARILSSGHVKLRKFKF